MGGRQQPDGPVLTFVQVHTRQQSQRMAPPALWLPATVLALSMVLAAVGGVTLGVLAATQRGLAASHWIAVVQSHGILQLWGWFGASIVVLVFEFIVRLNGAARLPVRDRQLALALLLLGALSASLGLVVPWPAPLVEGGWLALLAGSLCTARMVYRIAPARPLSIDLHPAFFRAGAVWLVLSACLGTAGMAYRSGGVLALGAFDAMVEVFLRGFCMNIIVAVGLRAFPGHLGLAPVAARDQRVLYRLLNVAVVCSLATTIPLSVGLFGFLGDVLFAGAVAWATHAFGMVGAARSWRRAAERYQLMVPLAWVGLVAYAVLLIALWVLRGTGSGAPALMVTGAVRHVLMLGFVAPLLIAMLHVVLERFGTGRLAGRDWLTVAFVLMLIAWPLRVVPPLLDPATAGGARAVMASAGGSLTVALLLASGASMLNAVAAVRFTRQFAAQPTPTVNVPGRRGSRNDGR